MRPRMNRVSSTLAAWLDGCLPPRMRDGSAETARRARVAVLFALVEVLFNLSFALSRVALGQYALRLRATLEADELVVSLSDDGRGVDWEGVRARAEGLALPSETLADLEQALFADGLSTKEEVTEISGRGIGLGAVRAAVLALDGRVVVRTTRGQGSTWEFRFRRGYEAVITPPYVSANRLKGPGGPTRPAS